MHKKKEDINRHIFLFVSNAMDEEIREERIINTDSPAARRKVIGLCKVLKNSFVDTKIVSMGRGKANGKFKVFNSTKKTYEGIEIIYAPFSHIKILSQIMSFCGLAIIILRFRKQNNVTVLFYNRLPAYILSMYLSRILGFKVFLDLEDGYYESIISGVSPKAIWAKLVKLNFDLFCRDGTLLACEELGRNIRNKNKMCYYGAIENVRKNRKFTSSKIRILMSGTINNKTGLDILVKSIELLRSLNLVFVEKLEFHISGYCEFPDMMKKISAYKLNPLVFYHGRLSKKKYENLLDSCDIGLSLKPIGGEQADTTFPSKVVEYGEHGLLIISTDISDVRKILFDGAIFLPDNGPEKLIDHLKKIVEHPKVYAEMALTGQKFLLENCAKNIVSRQLSNFFFKNYDS